MSITALPPGYLFTPHPSAGKHPGPRAAIAVTHDAVLVARWHDSPEWRSLADGALVEPGTVIPAPPGAIAAVQAASQDGPAVVWTPVLALRIRHHEVVAIDASGWELPDWWHPGLPQADREQLEAHLLKYGESRAEVYGLPFMPKCIRCAPPNPKCEKCLDSHLHGDPNGHNKRTCGCGCQLLPGSPRLAEENARP
jgi:hypothetical protein